MALLDGILGGSKSTSSAETLSRLSPGQEGLLNENLLPFLKGEGNLPRERTPFQGMSLQALEDLVQKRASGEIAPASDILRGIIDQGPQDFEDFFTRTVQDPALERFQEDVLPGISRKFSSSFYGSERREADQRAQEEFIDSLMKARSGLAFKTEEAQRDRALRAAGLLPQSEGQDIQNIFTGLRAEQFPEQQQINNILRTLGLQTQENVVTVDPGEGGILQGLDAGSIMKIIKLFKKGGTALAGGLGTTAGLGASAATGFKIGGAASVMASSRDYKENNEPTSSKGILKKLGKLNIEKWNYKEDDIKHLGPMAEDFKEIFGVGDGKTIALVDVVGVVLSSIKALSEQIDQLVVSQQQEI